MEPKQSFLRLCAGKRFSSLYGWKYSFAEPGNGFPLIIALPGNIPMAYSVIFQPYRSLLISAKNQVRRSVSSIQFSIKLAVATSLCRSQTSCVARKARVSC